MARDSQVVARSALVSFDAPNAEPNDGSEDPRPARTPTSDTASSTAHRCGWSSSDLPHVGDNRIVNAEKLTEGGVSSLSLRFYLVSLLPSALLTFFSFALWASGAPGPNPSIGKAIARLETLTGAQIALLLVGVVLSAVILQPFQVMLVQLLEGYWRPTPIGQLAMDIGIEVQRRRMRALEIGTAVPERW